MTRTFVRYVTLKSYACWPKCPVPSSAIHASVSVQWPTRSKQKKQQKNIAWFSATAVLSVRLLCCSAVSFCPWLRDHRECTFFPVDCLERHCSSGRKLFFKVVNWSPFRGVSCTWRKHECSIGSKSENRCQNSEEFARVWLALSCCVPDWGKKIISSPSLVSMNQRWNSFYRALRRKCCSVE